MMGATGGIWGWWRVTADLGLLGRKRVSGKGGCVLLSRSFSLWAPVLQYPEDTDWAGEASGAGPAMGPGGTGQPGAARNLGLPDFKAGGQASLECPAMVGGVRDACGPSKLQRPPERVGCWMRMWAENQLGPVGRESPSSLWLWGGLAEGLTTLGPCFAHQRNKASGTSSEGSTWCRIWSPVGTQSARLGV